MKTKSFVIFKSKNICNIFRNALRPHCILRKLHLLQKQTG